jgi:two-component system NtrC family sensor kinase
VPIDQIEVLLAMSLVRAIGGWVRRLTRELRDFTDYTDSPRRYKRLRRNMILMSVVGTTLPLIFLGYFNYHQFQRAMKAELVQPLRILVNRTKHSFELFLTERLSALSFIASAYSWEELADEKGLHRIFQVMKKELGGFVDIGLINGRGVQVNYVGPYDLKGKDYSDQAWFQEVNVRGRYVSEVFMGYRKFPHFVIAVERQTDHGKWWVLRATVDTEKFNNLIASMGLTQTTDAFVVNRQGVSRPPPNITGRLWSSAPSFFRPQAKSPWWWRQRMPLEGRYSWGTLTRTSQGSS